ncbi:O-antigen ligase family protein [Sunxiuqinia sp. A32]|uniref:O-antigen ligase family protein n=1 Tax=Sunxiuqinia sp. A32 TaxID=3461496 RepID=UPI004045B882
MIDGLGVSIDIYWYFPLFILIFFFFIYIGLYEKFDKNILLAILLVLILSFIGGYKYPLSVMKQIINICFFLIVSYGYIKYMNFDLDKIMKHYFTIVKIFIFFGGFQVLLFALGQGEIFKNVLSFLTIPGSITIRFQSFDREPSFAAYNLLPALFISLHNLIIKPNLFISRTWSVVIILAYLLTLSLIAYVGIILTVMVFYLRTLNTKKMLYAFPLSVLVLGIIIAAYMYPPIKMRIDDTLKVTTNSSEEDLEQINLSTYAMYSNFVVTKSALENNPFFGSGLGTHEINYDKYIPSAMANLSDINKKEAASLALRLLSEGGIISFLIFIGFVFKNKSKYKESTNHLFMKLWLLNNSIFIMILLHLLRQGHYTVSGFCLFLLLYYYSNKKSTELIPSK